MRIAIVVYCNGALSLPLRLGAAGAGAEAGRLCFVRVRRRTWGCARRLWGYWASAPGSFFLPAMKSLVCLETLARSAQKSEFAGVETRREPLVARKDATIR